MGSSGKRIYNAWDDANNNEAGSGTPICYPLECGKKRDSPCTSTEAGSSGTCHRWNQNGDVIGWKSTDSSNVIQCACSPSSGERGYKCSTPKYYGTMSYQLVKTTNLADEDGWG